MVIRLHPALRIEWPTQPAVEQIEQLLAAVDEECPTALEEHDSSVVLFFASAEQRDRAIVVARSFAREACVTSVSISDESWAERSQASLTAVRVGRFVVTPPWARASVIPSDADIVITIVPSMGFGTGHHPSTRLCLQLLQHVHPIPRMVLDVGTGSGVLAVAAWRLGAEQVVAIDVDQDALTSAHENVELNGASIELCLLDLAEAPNAFPAGFDLTIANLTGAMIQRHAGQLRSLSASGGSLLVSGFQTEEESEVRQGLEGCGLRLVDRAEAEHWVAMRFET